MAVEWHIHMGAHKTATTHIQMTLAARQQELASKGTFYLPLKQTREMMTFRDIPRPLMWRLQRRIWPWLVISEFNAENFAKACAKHLKQQIDAMAGSATRVTLSEENLLGTTDRVFGGGYFSGSVRLNVLKHLSDDVPLHLYLCTRSLDGFLPSAYAQALRSIPASRLNFADTLGDLLQCASSWSDLVTQIQDKVPNAAFTVWDYADYAKYAQEIQGLITGCDLDTQPETKRPKSTQSPSATAIRLAEENLEANPIARLNQINAIYAAHPAGKGIPAFQPIPEDIRQHLKKDYERDLSKIETMPGVTFVRFRSIASTG